MNSSLVGQIYLFFCSRLSLQAASIVVPDFFGLKLFLYSYWPKIYVAFCNFDLKRRAHVPRFAQVSCSFSERRMFLKVLPSPY